MYVCTYHICKLMFCNKIQLPNTNPQCGASNSPQSLNGNGCSTTKDPPEQVRSKGGMKLGSMYTHKEGTDWI